jgi:type II secretory pathway predicted ATPase ExeA
MSIALKTVLAQRGIALQALADASGISRTAASLLANHGSWPARERGRVRKSIEAFLRKHGIEPVPALFKKAPARVNTPGPASSVNQQSTNEESEMLLRKHKVNQATREHFGLKCDPFTECRDPAEVFLSNDIRYVREAMCDVALHGGFLGVVGESGAGKSTLVEELLDRLQREQRHVIPVVPYVLASESTDRVGKPIKSQHIAEAIMATLAPLAKIMSSPEARFRQLHQTLRDSSRVGMRHVLVIEEAHRLATPTLRHLKGYLELKDGMRPLVSVVLAGQPELAKKLSEGNPELREVTQRIELITLPPLDNELEGYLKKRIEAAGVPLARVMDVDAIAALRARLSPSRKGGMSLLYPLMVNNCVACAMNIAAELGAPRVTADIVREV